VYAGIGGGVGALLLFIVIATIIAIYLWKNMDHSGTDSYSRVSDFVAILICRSFIRSASKHFWSFEFTFLDLAFRSLIVRFASASERDSLVI
jgi:hypothetical protein